MGFTQDERDRFANCPRVLPESDPPSNPDHELGGRMSDVTYAYIAFIEYTLILTKLDCDLYKIKHNERMMANKLEQVGPNP